MEILHLTKDNFEQALQENPALIVDLWAPWCMPCKMLAPILDEVAQELPTVRVGKVNVDEEPELAGAFRVMSIPMLLFFRGGRLVQQVVGLRGKAEILEMAKELEKTE